jgi:hypothetical protein
MPAPWAEYKMNECQTFYRVFSNESVAQLCLLSPVLISQKTNAKLHSETLGRCKSKRNGREENHVQI